MQGEVKNQKRQEDVTITGKNWKKQFLLKIAKRDADIRYIAFKRSFIQQYLYDPLQVHVSCSSFLYSRCIGRGAAAMSPSFMFQECPPKNSLAQHKHINDTVGVVFVTGKTTRYTSKYENKTLVERVERRVDASEDKADIQEITEIATCRLN